MPVPQIPDRFLCPITLDIMFNPVVAEDGRNYERSAIEQWFRQHNNTSPVTREPIGNRLVQNMDLRAETLEFLDLNAHYIHKAIETLTTNNHTCFIKALIKRNINNLDRQDATGQTPLHIAVINRKTDMIQLLLIKGANYKIRNNQHKTPKTEAKALGLWDVVDLIDNYLMRDTNQMDLNELRLITTAIQQQELQTEDKVVRLTGQMQRLSVNQPRFLKFCSWQAMELFALGMGVAGVAVIQHQNKTISNQKETITHLHKTLRQEQQMHKQDVLFLYDNLKIDVAEEQQIHKQAISFLYDKMKEAHTVAFKTQNFDTQGAEIPVPDGFEKQDCSFFVAGRCHHGVLSNHQEYASEYTVSGFTAFPWGGITAITKMVHMLS